MSVIQDIFEANAKVFKAFCDDKRLRILDLLRGGEKCACSIIDQMDIGQSSLSYHMKILCKSGVIVSRQEGKWTHYRLSEEGCRYAVLLLKELTSPAVDQAESSK